MKKQFVSINNIKPPETQFTYPTEEIDEEAVNEQSERMYKAKTLEFINKLIVDLLASKNPKSFIVALAYCSGMDLSYLFNTNTIEGLSKVLGISKQTLHGTIQEVERNYGLQNSNHKTNTEQYKQANAKHVE